MNEEVIDYLIKIGVEVTDQLKNKLKREKVTKLPILKDCDRSYLKQLGFAIGEQILILKSFNQGSDTNQISVTPTKISDNQRTKNSSALESVPDHSLSNEGVISPKKFKEFLKNSYLKITSPDPSVWKRLKKYYMNQIIWTETSEEAAQLYSHAKNIPCTYTCQKIEHNLRIYLNGAFNFRNDYVSVIKALSETGTPLVVKLFRDINCALFEAEIGSKLKERNIKGFVIPEYVGQAEHHYVLKMAMQTVCLDEFTVYKRMDSRPLDSKLLLKFTKQIKNSLDEMHEKLGYYHCDIKPSNILISAESEALICDLGSVAQFGETLKSSYNLPLDLKNNGASKKIDYILLTTTMLEMLGFTVSERNLTDIRAEVKKVPGQDLRSFLEKLLE